MTATIIPFPTNKADLAESQFYSTEMLHLDLAGRWLKERNWSVESGALAGLCPENGLALVTDAPSDLVAEAFEIAHGYVCEFLIDAFGFSGAELPTIAEFGPYRLEAGATNALRGRRAFKHMQDFAN